MHTHAHNTHSHRHKMNERSIDKVKKYAEQRESNEFSDFIAENDRNTIIETKKKRKQNRRNIERLLASVLFTQLECSFLVCLRCVAQITWGSFDLYHCACARLYD